MNGDIVSDVRQFNRFYTGVLGLLDRTILDSGFSLSEARVIYELNACGPCMAKELTDRLGIDKSYLSRMLGRLVKFGLVGKLPSPGDGRASDLALTETGIETVRELNVKSDQQIGRLLYVLTAAQRMEIRAAMETIQLQLEKAKAVTIRPYTQADIPFVIRDQIRLYETEYGFSSDAWKTYVADAVNRLVERFDSTLDCMLILEYNGSPAGCIAITHAEGETAQLRFFFLGDAVRGLGLGGRLMELAVVFCREKEYKRIFLWTCSKLHAARHLYQKHGFHITQTQENDDWGQTVLEERWDVSLAE